MTAASPRWGHIEDGVWYPLPMEPLIAAGYGPAPFDVKLPDGRVRRVVVEPKSGEEEA